MLRTFGFLFCLGPAAAAAGPVFEKGRDITPWLAADSLMRAEAEARRDRERNIDAAFLEALRLNEAPGDCIASDPVAGACVLSVS
jgi:hypothetical protein